MDIETGKSQSLGLKAMRARYLSDGYLLLIGTDALQVVPFDARTLTVKGAPQAVLDSVAANGTVSNFVIAANGTAAYSVRAGNLFGLSHAVLVDLAGAEQRVSLGEAPFLGWAVGSSLRASALDVGRGSPDIQRMTFDFRS